MRFINEKDLEATIKRIGGGENVAFTCTRKSFLLFYCFFILWPFFFPRVFHFLYWKLVAFSLDIAAAKSISRDSKYSVVSRGTKERYF